MELAHKAFPGNAMSRGHRPVNYLVALLDAAGAGWADARAWRFEEFSARACRGGMRMEGAGFCFLWEECGETVRVAYFEGGELPPSPEHMLAIEVVRGGLRIHRSGDESRMIDPVEPSLHRQTLETVERARAAAPTAAGRWHERMAMISAAMHLLCLARGAAGAAAAAPAHRRPVASRAERLADAVDEWLRENLAGPARLEAAAGHLGKSPRQLVRVLKAATGAGFAEHLNLRRLMGARSLLMQTGRSVCEIGEISGFNSREQLIRAFNRAFGWTPLQFRKAWQGACLKNGGDLVPLCRVSGRAPVRWLPGGTAAGEGEPGAAHTTVVANARGEIVELFRVTPEGRRRLGILESGGMVFIHRDRGGSEWQVEAPGSGETHHFVTPDDHATAIVSGEPGK